MALSRRHQRAVTALCRGLARALARHFARFAAQLARRFR